MTLGGLSTSLPYITQSTYAVSGSASSLASNEHSTYSQIPSSSLFYTTSIIYTEITTTYTSIIGTSVFSVPAKGGSSITPSSFIVVSSCTHITVPSSISYSPCGADYCNCDGIAAPILTTTISGTVTTNCAYTTQPITDSCSAIICGMQSAGSQATTSQSVATQSSVEQALTMLASIASSDATTSNIAQSMATPSSHTPTNAGSTSSFVSTASITAHSATRSDPVPTGTQIPHCDYVLGSSTIIPDLTGCHLDHCLCGSNSIFAALLTSTISGATTLHCQYTTQPTARRCPTSATIEDSPTQSALTNSVTTTPAISKPATTTTTVAQSTETLVSSF